MSQLSHVFLDAWRGLRRRPGFSLLVILCFALGIGANTAVFSVINAVLVRPLPYPQADRLVLLWSEAPSETRSRLPSSVEEFFDYRERLRQVDDLTAMMSHAVNLTGSGDPEHIEAARVTHGFFSALGLSPLIGQHWAARQDLHGDHRVTVLSYELWQRRFGSEREIVGRDLVFDGEPYTVIGVAPPGIALEVSGVRPDLWVPLDVDLADLPPRSFRFLRILGRLGDGVGLEAARRELDAVTTDFRRQYPEVYRAGVPWGAELVPLREELVGEVRAPLMLLLAAVGLVLLIACANVVHLLLARAAAQRHEAAVRRALGASGGTLVARSLLEALLLAVAGGALGSLFAVLAVRGLANFATEVLPRQETVGVDATVLLFAFGVSLLAGLVAGLVPAFRGGRRNDIGAALVERGAATAGRSRLSEVLVALEVAVAVVVLIGTGLVGRSFLAVMDVDPGFTADRVLTGGFLMPAGKYPDGRRQAAHVNALVESLERVPGIDVAAVTSTLPLSTIRVSFEIEPEGARSDAVQPRPSVDWRSVTGGYFQALGMPLIAGRSFAAGDRAEGDPVAVIDQRLAERLWHGADESLGQKFSMPVVGTPECRTFRVVGVVGHTETYGLEEEAPDQVYTPFRQTPIHFGSLVVHTEGDPMTFGSEMAEAVWAVDAEQPLTDVRTLEDVLDASVAGRALGAALLVAFASLALLLSILGVYGVTNYQVSRRQREIGLRIALGADRGAVVRRFLLQSLKAAVVGVGVGTLVALLARKGVAGMLFGVAETDLASYLGAALLLAAAAAFAAWWPARRAAAVDPASVLREE